VATVQVKQATPARERVEIRTLGPATVSAGANGPSNKIGLAIFFGVLLIGIGSILGTPRVVAAWRRVGDEEDELDDVADISEPTPALVIPYSSVLEEPQNKVRQR
jgi:hypothetical protein